MTSTLNKQTPLKQPFRGVALVVFWLKFSVSAIFYFSTIIALNGIQVLTLVIRPFSVNAFRAANRFIANQWWTWSVIGAEKVLGVEFVMTGDDVPPQENALIFANHQQMPDIVVIMMLAYRKGRLGDMKWFVKHVIKYVPGIGWGMQFLDCLFLKRDWMADKPRILATFQKILTHKVSIWLITFVEGTRITPAKLAAAREFAAQKNLPLLNYVMLPRTRGFTSALEGLKGHVDAVYDLTIGYETGIPRLYQMYGGAVKRVHLDVRRFPIASLPVTETERAQWLVQRFVRKDKIMGEFFQTGQFPQKS